MTTETPTNEVTPEAKKRGRPVGSKNASKVAPFTVKLTFADNTLKADNGAELVAGQWQLNGYNVENAKAEWQAALKSANTLASIVAKLAALPTSVDPAALLAAKVDTESVYAAMDYKRATR